LTGAYKVYIDVVCPQELAVTSVLLASAVVDPVSGVSVSIAKSSVTVVASISVSLDGTF